MNRFILLVLLVLSGAMQGLANQPGPTAIVGRWQPVDTQGNLEIYALQGRFMVKSWVPLLPRGSIAITHARACEAVPYWGQLLCRTSASMKGEPGRAALSTTPTTGKRTRIPPKTAVCQYFDGVRLRWDTTIWPHGDVVPGTVTHSPAPWHIRLSYRPTRVQVSPRGLEAAVKESNSLPPCPKIILRLASAQS